MKIGVFDSGIGGQAVARAILRELPDADLLVREDRANLPYGNKTSEELLELVSPILASMVTEGCSLIVVACNTVSTNIITLLRERLTVPLVALEPMVKPAATISKSGVIAVCATPATLNSERYKWLKSEYAQGLSVLEPDCSDWASMIEHNQIDQAKVEVSINEILDKKADVVVLGCTHYHWIEQDIRRLCAGRAQVLQPTGRVIAQLIRALAQQS